MIHDLETLPNHTTLISKIPANLNVSSLKELILTVESLPFAQEIPMNSLLKWRRQKKESSKQREG